jgi:hypothetical protein
MKIILPPPRTDLAQLCAEANTQENNNDLTVVLIVGGIAAVVLILYLGAQNQNLRAIVKSAGANKPKDDERSL